MVVSLGVPIFRVFTVYNGKIPDSDLDILEGGETPSQTK